MEKLIIEGNRPLKGEVEISGSKNAALPIMAATLLTDEPCIIRRVPKLRDTMTMLKLLRSLGKRAELSGHEVIVESKGSLRHVAEYQLVSTMRGSFCVLGPLLAKLHKARVSLPGGCVIGVRPVDLHLKGLHALGTKIEIENGYVVATAKNLRGTSVYLGGVFGSSVLATANVLMAATLAKGQTTIESAACEPEIENLCYFLQAMGAQIDGVGSHRLVVSGVKRLHGARFDIIPDRIEAGTYILLAAATRSDIRIKGAHYAHLWALVDKLDQMGIRVINQNNVIRLEHQWRLKPVGVTTHPYPGFPTDLQAQFMSLMTITPGVSIITERVYPDRFIHIAELHRMGADIRREGSNAIIQGVKVLHGAPVMASDLRASAGLVIAGLMAKGRTEIHRMYHLERGYENLDDKLMGLGAKVYREKE